MAVLSHGTTFMMHLWSVFDSVQTLRDFNLFIVHMISVYSVLYVCTAHASPNVSSFRGLFVRAKVCTG